MLVTGATVNSPPVEKDGRRQPTQGGDEQEALTGYLGSSLEKAGFQTVRERNRQCSIVCMSRELHHQGLPACCETD